MRKIVENTNLRSVNTMTAEEIEKLALEQQLETEKEGKMGDNTRTRCVCGHECQEMDLSLCDICGEIVCDICANSSVGAYLCGECFEVHCDKEMPAADKMNEAINAQILEEQLKEKEAMKQDNLQEVAKTMINDEPKEDTLMQRLEKVVKWAHSEKKEKGVFEGIEIKVQSPYGKSLWAQWVKFGYLKPNHVYWAFRTLKSGNRQWLGVYVDSGRGKGRFFDLTTDNGRAELMIAEEQFRQYLISKGSPWCTKSFLKARGHWESWDLNQVYENLYKNNAR